jgi:hypothetical protein
VVWQKSSDTLFFREASGHTLEKTASGWRLHFADDDLLTKSALPILTRLSTGTTYDLRVRELGLLLPWMQRIAQGQPLILKAEEWINKTWGKGNLEILAIAQDGSKHQLGKWGAALGSEPYETALPALFAWTDLAMDPDVEWETDEEFTSYPYDEALHPYRNGGGEVDYRSVELHLNEVGRAFLLLDEHARQGEQLQLGP